MPVGGMTGAPLPNPSPGGRPPSFNDALRFWLKLGFVSFGGPAGQIAIMHRELVERARWVSERRFLHALNYCMLLPGPEAQQLATYIGWLLHGVRGGIAAGALFVLPSLAILIALSWIYVRFGTVPAIAAVLYGVKPAVVAIVLAAACRIGSRVLRHPLLWAIAAAAFLSLFAFAVAFPLVILGAAALGAIGGRLAPGAFRSAGHSRKDATHAPAVIDDDTPTPAHALFSPRRTATIVVSFLALWGAAVGVLLAFGGWESAYVQMARFFTQAALLTFGGAYAVLPYVLQGAVDNHGWLTATQMIDGLALGETTPGPLIMIVAFVGYLGAGAMGATVATFFTFLPSFLFILAGAPYIESTRDDLNLHAPLTAITAAVVGVIVNLAVFFSWRVFWPFDPVAIAIGVVALAALVWRGVGVIPVILASGLAGLASRALQGAT
jgi:chromate transporter